MVRVLAIVAGLGASIMAAMRPDILKPCARCGSQFILAHSGQRYCSDDCYVAARREYQRVWHQANNKTARPVQRMKPRIDGDWRRARDPRRSRTGCGQIMSYFHSSGRYRVDHYRGYAELPYVALRLTTTNGSADMIGR